MLKITQASEGGDGLLLKLEGELLEPWLAELSSVCARAAQSLRLDLSALRYADTAGVQFLRDCLNRGVAISSCSGFMAELLRREDRP